MKRWIILAAVVLAACSKGRTLGEQASNGDSPTATPALVQPTEVPPEDFNVWEAVRTVAPAPPGVPDIAACERPYTDDSIFNQPIRWREWGIHPDNDIMIADLWGHSDEETDGFMGSNTHLCQESIYVVDSSQPLVAVTLENSYRDSVQEGPNGEPIESLDVRDKGGTVYLPIPNDAEPSDCSDLTIVVVVNDTGYEYGLRGARQLADGTWEAVAAYEYHVTFDGVPEKNFQFRGYDSPLLGGNIRACEIFNPAGTIRRTPIQHATLVKYPYPMSPNAADFFGYPPWIPPFTDSDGFSWDEGTIPEGARIAIDPRIPLREVIGICNRHPGCVHWVVVMQRYGGFVSDQGHHPTTLIENERTANWAGYNLDWRFALRDIPQDWYVVVNDWDHRPPADYGD